MTTTNTSPVNTGDKLVRDEKGRIVTGSASLNPAGKPKGSRHMATLLREALQERAKNSDGILLDKTYFDLVIQRLISDNIKYGKRTELIFDRIDGQAKQEIDITTNDESINVGSAEILEIARRVSAELKIKETE